MVGLCALIDSSSPVIDDLTSYLSFLGTETVHKFELGRTSIAIVSHSNSDVLYVETSGSKILLFGSLHTIRTGSGHKKIRPETAKEKIKKLYEEQGPGFVDRINGEFVGVIERENGDVMFTTDRLSTKPVFTTSVDDGVLASTNLPSLISNTNNDYTIDRSGLAEYFGFNRIFGTKTAIEEIDQLPPATLRKFNRSGDIEDQTYWVPTYAPRDWSVAEFAEKLADLIGTILSERVGDGSYGLLLSGGSDSRLFLSQATQCDMTAYTMGDWWNREVEIAHQAAATNGVPFRFLRRDENYHRRVLDKSPQMCNFVSRFDQAHALGFVDQIMEEVDTLINGMFADTFFKGHFLPVRSFNTPVGEFDPPIQKTFQSIDQYITYLAQTRKPEYVDFDRTYYSILSNMIKEQEDGVVSHGVKYPDLRHMIMAGAYYPLTNQKDILLYQSLNHMGPTITPFLDDRLIELHLTIPPSVQLRGKLVNRALSRLSEELSAIPHSGTNMPPDKSFFFHFLGDNITRLRRNLLSSGGEPQYSNDPWPDKAELLRTNDFALESLIQQSNIINGTDILDQEAVHRMYDRHISGDNSWEEIYSLITALEILDTCGIT
jgi:asparagine synthase (glutamine-hydrolysing)